MIESSVRIYLANLTHLNDGKPVTESVPLNIGFLAEYIRSHASFPCEIRLFHHPDRLMRAIENLPPTVLGTSNYAWNGNLNYEYLAFAKECESKIVTLMGGPNYPGTPDRQTAFLAARPALDFYLYQEAECSLLALLEALFRVDFQPSRLGEEPLAGVHFLRDGRFLNGGAGQRVAALADIPSPYLSGLMDPFLAEGLVPVWQTNRGCPFCCAYCHQSNNYFSEVNPFPVVRLIAELEHISRATTASALYIADSNYGILPHDTLLTEKLTEVRSGRKWPDAIVAATSKVQKKRVFQCIAPLRGCMQFSLSMQSFHPPTLAAIRRKNLSFDDYTTLLELFREDGCSNSCCELILGLPHETGAAHRAGLRTAIDAGVDIVNQYTLMLLPDTPLSESDNFISINMDRRFRLIPRAFGKYRNQPIFEIEEVCVATDALTFKEYLEMRSLYFVVSVFYNLHTVPESIRLLRTWDVSVFDWLEAIHSRLCSQEDSPLRRILKDYISETEAELFPSPEALLAHYDTPTQFESLELGDAGSNLIMKYSARALGHLEEILDIGLATLAEIRPDIPGEFLDAIRSFSMARRSDPLLMDKNPIEISLSYDIPSWRTAKAPERIEKYHNPVRLRFYQSQKQQEVAQDLMKLFGNRDDSKGKILARMSPTFFWRDYIRLDG